MCEKEGEAVWERDQTTYLLGEMGSDVRILSVSELVVRNVPRNRVGRDGNMTRDAAGPDPAMIASFLVLPECRSRHVSSFSRDRICDSVATSFFHTCIRNTVD